MDVDSGEVRACLSEERFEPYLRAASGEVDVALALYQWNCKVSAAFLVPLQHLEIGMRNAIHRELTTLVGRPDWWTGRRPRLAESSIDMINRANRECARRGQRAAPGDVVATLSFGFWVSLFSSGRGLNYEMSLWRPALHRGFPGYRGARAEVHRRLETLRLFRNRIAHHEPIYSRHLEADHQNIFQLIEWISLPYATWVRSDDNVPTALDQRPRLEVAD